MSKPKPKDPDHIKALKPDARNLRSHNPRNIGMIEDALKEVGAARSVVIDENNNILAGNGTLEAAAAAGITKLKVVDADGETIIAVRRTGLSARQKQRLAAFDNRTAELAEWNPENVQAALVEDEKAFEGMFGADEMTELLNGSREQGVADAEPQIDRAAELNKEWKVKPGDIWIIGDHRLMCGDSTKPENAGKVMQGDKARLVATDPPYGVKYGDKLDAANPVIHGVRSIQNDNLTEDGTEALWRAAFTVACGVSMPGGTIYAAAAVGNMLLASMKAFEGSGYTFKWQLIWKKDRMVFSRADYHFSHENILYGWKEDGPHFFTDDRKQVSVFEYDNPRVSDEHPTMKPPPLYAHIITNSSIPGDVIYDPFLGSGTTMIACQNTGRLCRGLEIKPEYCAVILQRMKDAFDGIAITRLTQ